MSLLLPQQGLSPNNLFNNLIPSLLMEARNQKTTKFKLSGNVYYPPGCYKQTKDDPVAIRHNNYVKILD